MSAVSAALASIDNAAALFGTQVTVGRLPDLADLATWVAVDEACGRAVREARPDAQSASTVAEDGLPRAFSEVRRTVQGWWPAHWPLVEAQLAACGTLLLKDVGQALALFAIGPSGTGKNTALKMFGLPEPEALVLAKAGLEPLVEQLDAFTLSSFLSHFSEEKAAVLEERALYRRLKHRVLLTPELALMFRGNRAVLETMFSKLALILDGEGIRSASGTQGVLGQKGDFTFVWLGGTTPFRVETWRTMAQLGTRLLFFRVADDALDTGPADEDYVRARTECNQAVSAFLSETLSAEHRRSRPWPGISTSLGDELRSLAELLAAGQAMRSDIGEDEPVRPSPNHFHMRLALIVRGRALLHGRDTVADDDLAMARHIVRSSMPGSRGPVLIALHEAGALSAGQVADATGLSHQYVLKTLHVLKAVEVVDEGEGGKWALNLS